MYRASAWNIVAIVLKLAKVCYLQARQSHFDKRLRTTFITLASAVVDSRTLTGVLGWIYRNYLHQPALCGVYEWPTVGPVLAGSPVTRRD